MKSLRYFTTLVLVVLISGFVYSKDIPKGVTLVKDGNGYVVNFQLPAYSMKDIKAEGNTYTNLEIDDYGITSEVGLPQLPQITFALLIGNQETKPGIVVLNDNKSNVLLANRIYPVQMPWEKNKSIEDRPFVINSSYYNSKGSIDGPLVTISEPFVMAGAKGVFVTIYPFKYNPSTNTLVKTEKGTFKLSLNYNAEMSIAPSRSFDELYNNMFLNYRNSGKFTPTNNYLIITAPDFESGLAPFVAQKTNLGYNVTVVNTTVTGTTNTAIKAYIQNLYNTLATRPEFILLVGDVDKIPCWIGGGEGTPSTDWNYALLEGSDLYVDAFLGRFPIQNLTQLGNMITKTVYMENNINSLWKKNVFMASTDNHTISEGTHNMVIDSFFIPNGYTVNTKLYSYYGATTAQVSQSIDSGKIFAIYSGHGSETSWADGPVFSQANVNALNNTIFPYVYSFACITGSYHISGECFAETWARSAKASSVFWGSSVNSYWTEDDILERRFVKALYVDNLKKNAQNFVQGKIYTIQYFGSITPTMQRYIEMYNCMGDPSIYQVSYGPAISHTPLPNTENLAGPYVVNCTVTPSGQPITSTKLFWSRTVNFDSLAMSNSGGNNWIANIPGNSSPANYKYYIRTTDAANRTTILPGGAPGVCFTFTASADTAKPVIVHIPILNTPKNQWPCNISATVTDNLGVDSVWVKWYKNTPSTGIKHKKLALSGGNSYAGLFNSDTTQVNYNDSIFYRVFARDVGSLHNSDSSALNKFKIVAIANAIVGTGTTAVAYPFYTFYDDSRTDMLYPAADIIAGGGTAGTITKIGFNVTTASSQVMNGFNIKMQNISASSISTFTSTNWTTVYNGTYTVPGTGWQTITLQTPYYWNGTSNLLIEICFNNNTYTTNTSVNATPSSGTVVHQHQDLTTTDGCTAITTPGTGYTARPNLSLTIDLSPTGVIGNENRLPVVYSLSQNYPNPFNPVTKINYALPKQGLVTMKIFDILGREIMTLVNEVKSAGNYSVDFDGTNFASGVYFYKLESGSFVDTKRMLMIK